MSFMPSIKSLTAAALLALGSLSAQAALYDFSYTAVFSKGDGSSSSSAAFTLTGTVDGVLQGDANTVVVSNIVALAIDGHGFTDLLVSGSASAYVGSGTLDGQGSLTLDGSAINLVAANDAAASSSYLEMYSSYPAITLYFSSPAYTEYVTQLPLNSSWHMALQASAPAVPEPGAAWLMLAGAPLLLALRRRGAAARD